MEKLVQVGILFDFYGKLLTEKQYEVIDLYYNNDFSLSEIGETMGVSRQGVFDNIKRAEKKLFDYEVNLGLVNKFSRNQENIIKIINHSNEIIALEAKDIDVIKKHAKDIKNIGNKLIE